MEQYNLLKGESVENHPLSHPSSDSSSTSSLELDNNEKQALTSSESKNSSRKGRVPSVGRLREFLSKSEDQSKVEATDGSMYYNIWHNKSKILSNLKKQATESVRQLTQSASLDTGSSQGFFFKLHEDSGDSPPKTELAQKLPNQTGLLKAATDNITENSQDNDVTNYLQGLKNNDTDPLTVLRQKEDEERQKEEEDFFDVPLSSPRGKSVSTSSAPALTAKEPQRRSDVIKPARKSVSYSTRSYYRGNTVAVSLSSLMTGKQDDTDDDIVAEGELKQDKRQLLPDTHEEKQEIKSTKPEVADIPIQVKTKEEIVPDPPSVGLLLIFTFFLFLYFVLPLPTSLRIACSCFVVGCLSTAAFLCIFAPRSRRPPPFLTSPINSSIPYALPLSIYDPDQIVRGWMNEIAMYDPDTYHISNTTSVFVTLDGNTLRLQTPQKSIPRRSVFGEGKIPISNVTHQRMFDITFAKVYLQPAGLVKKRVWSKKYPICVEIPCEKTSDSKKDIAGKKEECDAKNPPKDSKLVNLFGRTDRQKEEWFYRIQRSINNAHCKHKRNQKTAEAKQKDRKARSSIDATEDWGIIEDHYEEEIYVASSVCDITKHTGQPVKLLQDYFVHISRLFPQSTPEGSPTPSTPPEKPSDKLTEERQVSWLNVMLGRVMFDFLRQPLWTKWISVKVQKKLDKIKLPYFIGELKLTEMNLGSSVPLFHEISLPKLDAQGTWIDAEVTYSGTVQMTLKTKLVLTKLGKNETLLLERESGNRTNAITDSDAEDSAESSDDEESAVSRFVGQVQSAASRWDGQQFLKDAIKSMGRDPPPSESSSYPNSPLHPDPPQPQGAPPKKWIRIVDSITKSKYFQKATETDYIRKKLETVSNTPMLLTVELVQLKGTLVINIPPPPTDRIWYGFREPPQMLLKAHPKVGERVVKTSHVTDWIENKLQQEVTKFLVMPNMDDIPIPIMFHNREDPT